MNRPLHLLRFLSIGSRRAAWSSAQAALPGTAVRHGWGVRTATLAIGLVCLGAQANQSLMTSGPGLTFGPVYKRANLDSTVFNPANGRRLLLTDEVLRLGIFQGAGRFEVGRLDNLRQVTDLIRADVDAVRQTTSLTPQAAKDLVRSTAPRHDTLTTASAFDGKLARVTHASLGYSTELTRWLPTALSRVAGSAQIDVGARLNVYRAQLERQLVALVDPNGNAISFDLDTRSNKTQSSAAALDFVLMWGDEYYQLGATLYNLGSPKLPYPDPVLDASGVNSAAAQSLIDGKVITRLDAVVLRPHAVLEASVFSANRRWLMQSSLATHQTSDVVGEPQRVGSLALAYNAERYASLPGSLFNVIAPSARLGLRRNLVGSRLSIVSLGMSWGVFSLDLSSSQKSINVDGSMAPRAAGVAFSVAEKF
jgi:hypothetical protein